MTQKSLDIILLQPSGFCAGVERAVTTVEQAIKRYGTPIYVKHQIVHNKRIISDLESRGVVFINNLNDAPDDSVLIFNAHGVTKEFEEATKERNIYCIDATCPLVKKVHREAKNYINKNKKIIIIGHKNHPEVIATKSRVSSDVLIIENVEDANLFNPEDNTEYAFVTQTTLSVDYINEISKVLQEKIPDLIYSKNICYATQNRQDAIKKVIDDIDGLLIVGSSNSSNSKRLQEIGINKKIPSFLIDDVKNIPYKDLLSMNKIAISAGASSPDYLIKEIVENITEFLKDKNILTNSIPLSVLEENVKFILPKFK